jgi:hypothetical protein
MMIAVRTEAKTIQLATKKWRRRKDLQTSEAGNDGDEDPCLCEEPPWLDDDATNCEQDSASLSRNVSREDTGQVHAGSDIVLCYVDEDLMGPNCKSGKERQSSTAGSVEFGLSKG